MNRFSTREFGLRLAGEGVVIVASILMAFALDAWWDRRTGEAEVRKELANVRRELQDNRRRLDLELGKLDRIGAADDFLLGVLDADPLARSVAVPDTIVWIVTLWAPTLDPSIGAVEAIVSSGLLASVPDLDLRNGLAGLRDRFEDVVEEEVVARRLFVERQFPLISTTLDLAGIAELEHQIASMNWDYSDPIPSLGNLDYPNSLSIRNVIRLRRSWYGGAAGEMRSLLKELDDLIDKAS